jgi:hypothetical protein
MHSQLLCVTMGSIIVDFSEPIIQVSRPAIVRIFPILFVRVWKYFVSLSIVFVVQLSISHISSSIGLTCVIYMK